jgi:phosphate transport system substrate-binding protein
VEWLSAENVVAVLTAVLGILASGAVLWYERRVPRRRRIGYRVQLDTPIGSNVRSGRPNFRLGLFNETPEMSDATLVLLRIENDGSQSIADNDYSTSSCWCCSSARASAARSPSAAASGTAR